MVNIKKPGLIAKLFLAGACLLPTLNNNSDAQGPRGGHRSGHSVSGSHNYKPPFGETRAQRNIRVDRQNMHDWRIIRHGIWTVDRAIQRQRTHDNEQRIDVLERRLENQREIENNLRTIPYPVVLRGYKGDLNHNGFTELNELSGLNQDVYNDNEGPLNFGILLPIADFKGARYVMVLKGPGNKTITTKSGKVGNSIPLSGLSLKILMNNPGQGQGTYEIDFYINGEYIGERQFELVKSRNQGYIGEEAPPAPPRYPESAPRPIAVDGDDYRRNRPYSPGINPNDVLKDQ
ncbi:MAG: hypothetical protein ABIH37_03690 [archaeon]